MDIFGFFDYKPKDFVNKSVNDILDMKQSKVKENFEKKYETDEVYMNELTEDQKKAIFLLRVLKKGLSKEDKDNILSLCDIEYNKSMFKTTSGSNIKKTPKPSRQSSMSPGNKSASQSQPQQTEYEYKEPSTEDEEEEEDKEPSTEEQPQQTGGKKHKKRKTNRKRKGKKKTQKNNNNI